MRKSTLITSLVAIVVVVALAFNTTGLAAGNVAKDSFKVAEPAVSTPVMEKIADIQSDDAIADEITTLIAEPAEVVYEKATPTVMPEATATDATTE